MTSCCESNVSHTDNWPLHFVPEETGRHVPGGGGKGSTPFGQIFHFIKSLIMWVLWNQLAVCYAKMLCSSNVLLYVQHNIPHAVTSLSKIDFVYWLKLGHCPTQVFIRKTSALVLIRMRKYRVQLLGEGSVHQKPLAPDTHICICSIRTIIQPITVDLLIQVRRQLLNSSHRNFLYPVSDQGDGHHETNTWIYGHTRNCKGTVIRLQTGFATVAGDMPYIMVICNWSVLELTATCELVLLTPPSLNVWNHTQPRMRHIFNPQCCPAEHYYVKLALWFFY